MRRPAGSKSSSNTDAQRVGARRVVGAVDDDERLVPEDLEAPGHPHRGEALLHDVVVEGRVEEALDRGEGDGGVVALVGAMEREEHVGVHGQGRLQGEQPTAEAELVLRCSRSRARATR